MTVEVGPLEIEPNQPKILCSHPRCDGRSAHWILPQTVNRPGGTLTSCSVHLARFVELVLRDIIARADYLRERLAA